MLNVSPKLKISFLIIKMIIRKAEKKDTEQLAKLYMQFWEVHKDKNPLHQPYWKINYKNCLKDMKQLDSYKDYICYVATENEKILGFLLFTIKKQSKFYRVKKYGYLEECVVDKKYRGKGVARKLAECALVYMKSRSIKYVSGTVEIDNTLALKVWQKLGFKQSSIDILKEI